MVCLVLILTTWLGLEIEIQHQRKQMMTNLSKVMRLHIIGFPTRNAFSIQMLLTPSRGAGHYINYGVGCKGHHINYGVRCKGFKSYFSLTCLYIRIVLNLYGCEVYSNHLLEQSPPIRVEVD